MKTPPGFRFSGIHVGLKPSRRDLALIASDVPCAAAAVVTQNKAKSAPALDTEKRVPSAGVRGIVLNSGNANALTGAEGVDDVRRIREAVATALGVESDSLLCASTGVIGVRMPITRIVEGAPRLVKELSAQPDLAAEAIMTTDTRVKMAARQVTLGRKRVTLSAICKGSGMVAPQLATVLGVVLTDAVIDPETLQTALRRACDTTFNRLNIDNEMSTNDTVFALANGKAAHPPLTAPELERFTAALTELCEEMAKEIAEDGEGATKMLEVRVTGAPDEAVAKDLASSISGSVLVKASIFGADPNWGRILATVGARAGSQNFDIDPAQAKVVIQDLVVYDRGPVAQDLRSLRGKMRLPEIRIDVNVGDGPGRSHSWGCDLTYDYVKINADYTSLIVQTESGTMAKDDRLGNYSPAFKRSLLVEALSYIRRLSGKRCVVKCGGEVLVKESLKRAFCEDIRLLQSVGLRPVVVHGGGPEIAKAMKKYGRKNEFVEGVSVGDDADSKVAEMVMTGAVNQEFVTLLNRETGVAVGVSGKDGALIRARKQLGADGRDLGALGEITAINTGFLEMLLSQAYVPVISPVALGDEGESYHVHADAVAAEVAKTLGASKLIYVTNVPGILEKDELVTQLTEETLRAQLAGESITGGMRMKAQSILKAIEGGVQQVHVVDGRTPHSLLAELFTDRGVGTLVQRG